MIELEEVYRDKRVIVSMGYFPSGVKVTKWEYINKKERRFLVSIGWDVLAEYYI